jgi:hypothetical protein
MVVCDFCKQEMTERVACTAATYDDFPAGVPLPRIPYGQEPRKFPNDPDPWPIRDASGFEATHPQPDVVHDHIRLPKHEIVAIAGIGRPHPHPACEARGHDRIRRARGRLVVWR